jgi:ABC-type sugar transport system permease subunit
VNYAVGTVVPSLVLALAFALALNGAGRVRALMRALLEGRVGEEGGEVVQAHEAGAAPRYRVGGVPQNLDHATHAVTRRGTRFVGLDNFAALFADPTFQRALLNNQ